MSEETKAQTSKKTQWGEKELYLLHKLPEMRKGKNPRNRGRNAQAKQNPPERNLTLKGSWWAVG